MPEYLAPGVYVEEVSFRARPIEGVPTHTTGMVGMAERGPLAPQLITSWLEYQQVYGGFIDGSPAAGEGGFLPHAVRGYFDNGGRRLFVVRVQGEGDGPATLADHLGRAATEPTAEGTEPEPATGLAALMALPDVALVAAPDEGVLPGLAEALLRACEAARDRFAVLASPAAEGRSGAAQVSRPAASAWGALYHPWVRVAAPHRPGGTTLVPPTGHVAGVMVRTDIERGVHKAPANEYLRGLAAMGAGLREPGPLARKLSRAEQEPLHRNGVNVIIDARAERRGVRVWGARTLSDDPEWRYVNVRRLFIHIERSLDRGTQWAVFEPNEPATWARVKGVIEDFLTTLWQQGMLLGQTPDEAFFVHCDRRSMTQNDIDHGRLIALVGVAPLRTAEFVVFRIGQWTADAKGSSG